MHFEERVRAGVPADPITKMALIQMTMEELLVKPELLEVLGHPYHSWRLEHKLATAEEHMEYLQELADSIVVNARAKTTARDEPEEPVIKPTDQKATRERRWRHRR